MEAGRLRRDDPAPSGSRLPFSRRRNPRAGNIYRDVRRIQKPRRGQRRSAPDLRTRTIQPGPLQITNLTLARCRLLLSCKIAMSQTDGELSINSVSGSNASTALVGAATRVFRRACFENDGSMAVSIAATRNRQRHAKPTSRNAKVERLAAKNWRSKRSRMATVSNSFAAAAAVKHQHRGIDLRWWCRVRRNDHFIGSTALGQGQRTF